MPGLDLADHVGRIAASDYDGSLKALLDTMIAQYDTAITHRRPEEVLAGWGEPAAAGPA